VFVQTKQIQSFSTEKLRSKLTSHSRCRCCLHCI